MLLLGIATILFSRESKWQSVFLFLVSFLPLIATSIYWYALNNQTPVSAYQAAYLAWWLLAITSHIIIIASFVVNRKSSRKKALNTASIITLVLIYIPVFEGHDGLGYHRHNIWGLLFHFH